MGSRLVGIDAAFDVDGALAVLLATAAACGELNGIWVGCEKRAIYCCRCCFICLVRQIAYRCFCSSDCGGLGGIQVR